MTCGIHCLHLIDIQTEASTLQNDINAKEKEESILQVCFNDRLWEIAVLYSKCSYYVRDLNFSGIGFPNQILLLI